MANSGCTAWVNSNKTKCMILDGHNKFLGGITKKQFDVLINTIGENNIVFHVWDGYFNDDYKKLKGNKMSFNEILAIK